jgi:membrane protein
MKWFVPLLKDTFKQWSADKAARLAAALSFYTMLSIAPLLVIAVAIVGFVFGSDQAQQKLIEQISSLVGPQSADAIQGMLENAAQPDVRSWAGIIGLATLLWGASNVFGQLHESMNFIWNVRLKPGLGLIATIRQRLLSFSLVAVIGFLLLVSLILSAILTALGAYFANLLPGGAWLWQIVNFAVSLLVITGLFALMYRVIPDVKVAWRDMWLGAFVTALLFVIGKQILGYYLGRQSFGSTYGAAGSLVVLLVWIYYSAQIFFFGAEFTQVYATRFGKGMTPEKNVQFIDEGLAAKPRQEAAIQRRANAQASAGSAPQPQAQADGHVTGARKLMIGSALAGLLQLSNRRNRR